MDSSEERLREVLAAVGGDLWSLIDTAIAVAARDYPADLRLRREGIVQSLYALTPCRNCDPNRSHLANGHGSDSTRANGDGSEVTRANGDDPNINPAYRIEASPEMRSVSPTPSPDANASPELELTHTGREEEDRLEINIRELITIKRSLEDPDEKSDEETVVSLLQTLADMEVTYEALYQSDIGLQVNALRKHESEEVRHWAKQVISKWKVLVNAHSHRKPSSACDSSSSPVPTENASPQKIPAKSQHQNSNGPHEEFMRSPKRQIGVGSSGRSGSDYKAGSGSRREAPTKPNNNYSSSVAPPAKRREKEEDSLADQARLDSARKRLQENYQEAQNAKKQRKVQVMGLNEIPKPRNAFFRKGSTSRNR